MYNANAEASKPQRKMQECNRCSAAGYPNQMISFVKVGEDTHTGKIQWKAIEIDGKEHTHKFRQVPGEGKTFRRRRVIDIATVADVTEAKRLLSMGWDYHVSYPATLANIPHYVLVRRD